MAMERLGSLFQRPLVGFWSVAPASWTDFRTCGGKDEAAPIASGLSAMCWAPMTSVVAVLQGYDRYLLHFLWFDADAADQADALISDICSLALSI
eukprot:s1179_g37.t1